MIDGLYIQDGVAWMRRSLAGSGSGACGAPGCAGTREASQSASPQETDEPLRAIVALGSSVINPPVYSRAFAKDEDANTVAFQVFVANNTIDFSSSLVCSLEGSNDDENWAAIASSSITFGANGIGTGSVRVANLAWRYVRVKYSPGSPEFDGGVAIVRPSLHFSKG